MDYLVLKSTSIYVRTWSPVNGTASRKPQIDVFVSRSLISSFYMKTLSFRLILHTIFPGHFWQPYFSSKALAFAYIKQTGFV